MESKTNYVYMDDIDEKLHLYVCISFKGKKWGLQITLSEEQITEKEFSRQGKLLINSAIKALKKDDIITK